MNIEQGLNSTKIGRFEAMQGVKNALTGQREEINIRSQQKATQENDFHQVKTFTPEQAAAKNKVVATQQKLDRGERQLAWDTYASDTQRLLRLEQDWQANLQLPLIIEQKLGKAGKEQVLHAVQAKKALVEKTAQNLEINTSQEQIAPEQIKPMVEQLLTQAPEGLLLGSLATLAVWVINRLPNKIWKITAISTVLSLALSACASVAVVPKPELPNQNNPVAGESTGLPDSATVESNPTATIEPSPTATIEPSPTATERVMTLEERVDAFAAGQIEFPSDLSSEEYSAFIDEMNNHVGRQAIWVETFKNSDRSPVVLYFDIAQSKMVELPGTYEENRDIIDQNQLEMFVKISEEVETGNLQYTNSNGELITSPNSADVNWNLRVDASNYQDGLIDLPEVIRSASEPPEEDFWYKWLVELNDEVVFIPGILMDDTVSMLVALEGGWKKYPCLNMLFIVTDSQGKPLYGIRTFVGTGTLMFTGNEGNTLNMSLSKVELRNSNEIRRFEPRAVYYVSFANQQKTWDHYRRSSIDELQGTDSEASSFDNAFNQDVPNDGNIILAGTFFIKKK